MSPRNLDLGTTLIESSMTTKTTRKENLFLLAKKVEIVIKKLYIFILILPKNFVLNMLSAYYVCCILSMLLQTTFNTEANDMNPDQSAPSDTGPYCLQLRLAK